MDPSSNSICFYFLAVSDCRGWMVFLVWWFFSGHCLMPLCVSKAGSSGLAGAECRAPQSQTPASPALWHTQLARCLVEEERHVETAYIILLNTLSKPHEKHDINQNLSLVLSLWNGRAMTITILSNKQKFIMCAFLSTQQWLKSSFKVEKLHWEVGGFTVLLIFNPCSLFHVWS